MDEVFDTGADLGVVVAFGRLIPPAVLAAVPMVNVHFSLLPRWRGAAPVERAILAGDRETGVDVMAVEEGLDTGAIYARRRMSIGEDETADDLRERLVAAGTALLVEVLSGPLPVPVPQVGEAVYAHKIVAEDLHIDWTRPAEDILRQVRVGGAWTTWRGERFKVWSAASTTGTGGVPHPTGTDPIDLLEVQPAGKARMLAADWARGARWRPDDRLGS